MRKRILKGPREEYETMNEDGETIMEPDKALQNIANYYEDLYQARERKPSAQEWTEQIIKKNRKQNIK